jgi:uncharacterized membrane protein YccC
MPTDVPDGYKLERRWSLTHFLIGVFGAMAILGVMAKIFNFEAEIFGYLLTWKPVVFVGFMGEALVFILMGMMREMQYVPVDDADPSLDASVPSDEASTKEEALLPELQRTQEELSQEAERLAQQIREVRRKLGEQTDMLGSSMEDLKALYESQTKIIQSVERVQKQLSEESEGLGEEIAETRQAMRVLREQFTETTHRFKQFNDPLSSSAHSSNDHPSKRVDSSSNSVE